MVASSLMNRISGSLRRLSSSITTAHPSLIYLPNFLSPHQQSLLLSHSLRLLSNPTQTTSGARKKARDFKRLNPNYSTSKLQGFMNENAYEFSKSHSDKVIQGYREMLVREGLWSGSSGSNVEGLEELGEVLRKLYAFIPIPKDEGTPLPAESSQFNEKLDPPNYLSLHLLHLSGLGAIYPHVDNLQASGEVIVGVSLGGERVLKFKKKKTTVLEGSEEEVPLNVEGPDEFSVLLEPGSVYIQTGDLRSNYTHDIPVEAEWEGRTVGGKQRLSLMLRDKSKLEAPPPTPL